jgi:predicted nucleotidyltransferase component of viral defense system
VDITRAELLLYPVTDRTLQAPYSDHPRGITLPTYTLEEILIEKLCALMGRTEPRDLYDVYSLFERGDVDLDFLPANFASKCKHKGQDPTQLANALAGKARNFKKLWAARLAIQVADLPELDEVLRVVRQHLRALALV